MENVISLLINGGKAAFGLGIVIFVHELGHFLVAKLCGVKCEKFYVGFDAPIKIGPWKLPSALFRKKWGETEYGIGIIPLGGYVKMLGQDDNPANAAQEAERIKVASGEAGGDTSSTKLDPRSYPAKSVLQRMMIISAGVVFNLIFGVVFATVAYKMGVNYMPARIAGTLVGETAWRAGLQPGDQIIQIDQAAPESEHLRFIEDLRLRLMLSDAKDLTLTVRSSNGEKRQVVLSPRNRSEGQTIGVIAAQEPTISVVRKDSVAAKQGVKAGDQIERVSVAGTTTAIQGDAVLLSEILATHPHDTIKLSLKRTDPKTKQVSNVDIELPPVTEQGFGVQLSMGPISAVQPGSVAERAGLKEGDILRSLDGQPIGDPRALPTLILKHLNRPVRMGYQRGTTGEELEVELIPQPPRSITGHVTHREAPIALEPLGIGFFLEPIVQGVVPESTAAKVGLQPGDRLIAAKLVPLEQPKGWFGGWRKKRQINKVLKGAEVLDTAPVAHGWPFLEEVAANFETPLGAEVLYERGSENKTVQLELVPTSGVFDATRGIGLKGASQMRRADTWGEAFSLGLREIKDGLNQVVTVLRKIGKSYNKLGGPIAIATLATGEASQGLARLLLFLTMLSANLAVINFLPIPVLDGGHMMFLSYEGIVGKPVNERVAFGLTLIGFSLLMGLMVFVLGLDIHNFLL